MHFWPASACMTVVMNSFCTGDQILQGAVADVLPELDEGFLAVAGAYSNSAREQGRDSLAGGLSTCPALMLLHDGNLLIPYCAADLIDEVREEVVRQVTRRLPTELQILNLATQIGPRCASLPCMPESGPAVAEPHWVQGGAAQPAAAVPAGRGAGHDPGLHAQRAVAGRHSEHHRHGGEGHHLRPVCSPASLTDAQSLVAAKQCVHHPQLRDSKLPVLQPCG